MINTVIFDLDGTLTEFNLDVKACRIEVIHRLSKQGIPEELFSLNESAFDMLLKVKNHLGPKTPEETILDIKKMIFSIVESHELQAAKETKLFTGISETLGTLKKMNLKMGLCTISSQRASGYILSRFGIEEFFDAVFPRESVLAVKPNPIHLKAVLDSLKVTAQEAMFVGDSVKDVICANRLGVLAVGVPTGLSSVEQLKDSGSHYVVSSVTEIPKLVMQLNKNSRLA
jgi:HAD superfamily hydrolase (TIGR01549 family)